MLFDQLGLSAPLLRAIRDEGYATATPIQEQAIRPILAGGDLLGCAQTGTGKTAAFALPVLHRLSQLASPRGAVRPIRCLVLTPTRELAAQVGDSFRTYGRHLPLASTVIYGGVGQSPQVMALRRGVDIVVACPGRLLDLMNQGHVRLDAVEVLILDEADRMLDMGFLPDLKRIVAKVPANRQTLMFSATMPREIRQFADSLLRQPTEITVAPVSSAAETVDQRLFHVPRLQKQSLLNLLIADPAVVRSIVFTRTKHGADKVVRQLERVGITAAAIHGNKSQNARTRALDDFRRGAIRVLVASDIAARGLDIDGVTHIFNYDIPNEPETYVHRIGRTGRAGASGVAISLCDTDERAWVADIERLIRRRLPVTPLPAGMVPVAALPPAAGQFQQRGHFRGRAPQGGPQRSDPRRSGHRQPNRRDHGHGGTPRQDHGSRW